MIMPATITYTLTPVAVVRSPLTKLEEAPMQGSEGAPDAWLDVMPNLAAALDGLVVGQDIILITWLHLADRDVLKVHPRSDQNLPLAGVFATRSPDRPNPLGLHRVKILEIAESKLKVGPLEAIDGTPIVDIKAVLAQSADS
jgi:tRNA-Thr(GGU) m(6)t(6)A37 methyltransferase TsaA